MPIIDLRFWPVDQYCRPVKSPGFDKQFVRDYLETVNWNKTPPAPSLAAEIIEKNVGKISRSSRTADRGVIRTVAAVYDRRNAKTGAADRRS